MTIRLSSLPLRRALVTCAIAFVAAACEEGDVALVKDFVQEWAIDHAGQVAVAKAGFSSGDNLVDAAVGGYESVEEIHKADELMEAGREKQDPKKMDEALKLRPNDLDYRRSRANLALQLGDMKTYNEYAWTPYAATAPRQVNYNRQEVMELEAIDQRLNEGMPPGSVLGFKSQAQCRQLYQELYNYALNGYTNSSFPAAAEAERYLLRRQECGTLPQ